jgi:hypothetical protein
MADGEREHSIRKIGHEGTATTVLAAHLVLLALLLSRRPLLPQISGEAIRSRSVPTSRSSMTGTWRRGSPSSRLLLRATAGPGPRGLTAM